MPTPNELLKQSITDYLTAGPVTEETIDKLVAAIRQGMDEQRAIYIREQESNMELIREFAKHSGAARGFDQTLRILEAVAEKRISPEAGFDLIRQQHAKHLSDAESFLAMYRMNNGL